MTRNLDAEGNTISGYTYTYDLSGFILTEIVTTEEGTEQNSYGYDNAGQLIQAVTAGQGLLMAALYDGDDNRMFTASRTEDTKTYQLYRETEENTGKESGKNTGKNAPKTSARGEEGSIFWYGFGQNFIQALTVAKDTMGKIWMDTWETLVSAYHRKIAKDRADEEGIVANPPGITQMPGEGEVTYPGETAKTLIPYTTVTDTYNYYEIRNYVNDISRSQQPHPNLKRL